MSWNISRTLNELNYKIDTIANKGLINPLEEILDANNYSFINCNVINANSNTLNLQTDNPEGIITNADLTIGANGSNNIYANTIHYSQLQPPINPNGIIWNLQGSSVNEVSTGDFVFTQHNPYNGIITNTKLNAPTVSFDIVLVEDIQNTISFGFTTNTEYPSETGQFGNMEYGCIFYPATNRITQITNGAETANNIVYTNQTNLSVVYKIVNNNLQVFINEVIQPILSQPLAVPVYVLLTAYAHSQISVNNMLVNSQTNDNLEQILYNGNDAGNLSIVNLDSLNLNNDIECLGNITASKYINIGNAINNTSQLHLFYGDGTPAGNNFQVLAGQGDYFTVQQYKNNGLYNQPLTIQDNQYIQFRTQNLLLSLDNGATNNYVLNTSSTLPMYKQVFNNLTQEITGFGIGTSKIFSCPIYSGDETYNYGITYGEILFSQLNFNFSSVSPFPQSLEFNLYLSSGLLEFDETKGNQLIIPVANDAEGNASASFNSVIPIILYYNNETNFDNLFLCCRFTQLSLNTYTLNTQANCVISGYISKSQNGSISWGSN